MQLISKQLLILSTLFLSPHSSCHCCLWWAFLYRSAFLKMCSSCLFKWQLNTCACKKEVSRTHLPEYRCCSPSRSEILLPYFVWSQFLGERFKWGKRWQPKQNKDSRQRHVGSRQFEKHASKYGQITIFQEYPWTLRLRDELWHQGAGALTPEQRRKRD